MKKLKIIYLVFVFAALNIDAHKTEFTTLTGPFLGQKPPGSILTAHLIEKSLRMVSKNLS